MRECDPEHAPAGHSYVSDYLTQELSRHGKLVRHEFEHNGRSEGRCRGLRAGG